MKRAFLYDTLLGQILIREDCDKITGLSLIGKQGSDTGDKGSEFLASFGYDIYESVLIKEAAEQLQQYLKGKRKQFDIDLLPMGTPFQLRVWKALQEIPYGETRSYGQIAAAIGNDKAARAVGMANHNNPIMIIIPCHRVIGASGKLVGFGAGLDVKEQLLDIEHRNYGNGQKGIVE